MGQGSEAFDRLNPRNLGKVQRVEFHFKRGHARFEHGQLEAARGDLLKVVGGSDARPEFLEAARYYLAHIAYAEDRLTTALTEFEALASVDAFRNAVPVYIAQILHKLDRHEDLVDRDSRMARWRGRPREADRIELERLLGTALFHLDRCPEAEAHLEAAWNGMDTQDKSPGFSYIVGSCRLSNGHSQDAILALMRATGKKDRLEQYATHAHGPGLSGQRRETQGPDRLCPGRHLRPRPRSPGGRPLQPRQAGLRDGFQPFNDAIAAFEQYLEEYPDSPRRDEAYGFLLDVYLTTRNHERALDALDRIQRSHRGETSLSGPGLQPRRRLLPLGKARRGRCISSPKPAPSPKTTPWPRKATFWQGEIAMKAGRDAVALSHYRAFLNAPGSFGLLAV